MRHLLLDFGGPILRMPYELRATTAAKLGVDELDLSGGPLDPKDGRWRARDRGRITERDYWNEEADRFGLTRRAFMGVVYEPSGDHLIRDEAVPLIEEVLGAGARAGLLTNDMTAFLGVEWQRAISVLKRLDPIVDLSFADHRKPDPRAYHAAIEAMGVPAGDTVFVDDLPDNVEGGRQAGFTAVWFDVSDPMESYGRVRSALNGDTE